MNNVNLMPDLVSVTEPIYRWQITLSLYMCQIHKNKSHNSWNNSNYACGDAHACAPHLKRLYTIDLATTLNKLLIILPLTSNVSYADETALPLFFVARYCQRLCHHLLNQAPPSSTPRDISIFCANMVTTRSWHPLSTLYYIHRILLGS